jgi:hypothetical protein
MDRRSFIEVIPALGLSDACEGMETGASPVEEPQICVVETVPELATLRPTNTSCGPVAVARGYVRSQDGGGGLFLWDEESSDDVNRATVLGRSDMAGRWKRVHEGTVSIEAFGVGGEGVSAPRDVSSALSLAATLPAVKTVRCSGEYRLSSTVVLNGPLTIEGGVFFVSEECFRKREGDRRCAFAVAGSDVELRGVAIRGPSAAIEGPVLVINVERGSENFSLRNARVHQFTSVSAASGEARNGRVSRVVAVRLHQTGCRRFEIAGCEMSKLRAIGNGTVGDSEGVCTGILVGNTQGKFEVSHPTTGEIRNCSFRALQPIEDADGVKTQLEEGERGLRTLVENCTFFDCAKRGVKCQAPDTRVIGNTFHSKSLVTRNAVSIYRPHCTVSDNRIHGRFNFGVEVRGNDFIVESNRITGTSAGADLRYRDASGIWLRSGERGRIRQNTITGFLQSLTVAPDDSGGVDDVDVCRNCFESPAGNAVTCRPPEGKSTAGRISLMGNRIIDPGKRALLVQGAGHSGGQYRVRIDQGTIKGYESKKENVEVEAMYVRRTERLIVRNMSVQIQHFGRVLTTVECGRVLLADCDIETMKSGTAKELIRVSESGEVLIKGNVVPVDMTIVESEDGENERIRQSDNYTW